MATTDNFNRSNNDSLGANWTEYAYSDPSIRVYSNGLRFDTGDGFAFWNSTPGNDQYAQLVYQAGNARSGPAVRLGGTSRSHVYGYAAVYDGSKVYLKSFVDQTAYTGTELGNYTVTLNANDVVKISADGTAIKVYINDVQRISVTSSAVASGKFGILCNIPTGTPTADWDDWEADEIVHSVSITAVPLSTTSAIAATGVTTDPPPVEITAVPLSTIARIGATAVTISGAAMIANLPLLTLLGYGGGWFSETLPLLTCEATAETRSGEINQTLPGLTCQATGSTGSFGIAQPKLPLLRLSATGFVGQFASVDVSLPMLTLVATGGPETRGNLSVTLPMFYIMAHGQEVATSYVALVMNPRNMAVSEYDGFSFNSFALFNGQYLAAGTAGIYVLGGDKDGSSNIDSEILTGQLSMEGVKPRDIYLYGKSDGQILVTLSENEDQVRNSKVSYLMETLGVDRAKVPRGMNPDYLQIGIKNVSGCDFDLDNMEIYVEGLTRKKK